jgi:hypothetical protein
VDRLDLPTVTLCAVTSVNIEATVAALEHCMRHIRFGEALLLTDGDVGDLPPGIRLVGIDKVGSAPAYSEFMLRELVRHIGSEHCLVAQWDGFVANPGQWDDRFLEYDFIGAPWPQFTDGRAVGNGGFSLRSRKLLEACARPGFAVSHPEDVAIGRINRDYLEQEHSIRFADGECAARFAFERSRGTEPSFGFHGVFNMAEVLGADRFWEIYDTLDDRTTAFVDYWRLIGQTGTGPAALRRKIRFTLDRARQLWRSAG